MSFPRYMSVISRNCTSLHERHREGSVHRTFSSTLAVHDGYVLVDGAIAALEDGVMDALVDGGNVTHM